MFYKCFSHLTFKTVWYMTNKEMKIFFKKGNGVSEMSNSKSSLYIQVK